MSARSWIWIGVVLMLGFARPALSAKPTQTTKYLQMAREALLLGEMVKWKDALTRMQQALRIERPKMAPARRNMYTLWLWMMWSRYHQYRGKLPAIRQVSSFESGAERNKYIQRVQKSIKYLEQARDYLKRYNLLYRQIAERSDVRQQLQLQASLSLERDLQGTVTSAKIYVSLLQFAQNSDARTLQARAKQRSMLQALKKLKERQEDTALNKRQRKREQKKLSRVFTRSEKEYARLEKRLKGRRATANNLVIAGIVVGAVGLVAGAVGSAFVLDVALRPEDGWKPIFGPSNGICTDAQARMITEGKLGNQTCTREGQWIDPTYRNTQIGILVGAGVFVVTGGILLGVGIATMPKKADRERAVLKGQDVYLKTLPKEDKTSDAWQRCRRARLCSRLVEVR